MHFCNINTRTGIFLVYNHHYDPGSVRCGFSTSLSRPSLRAADRLAMGTLEFASRTTEVNHDFDTYVAGGFAPFPVRSDCFVNSTLLVDMV